MNCKHGLDRRFCSLCNTDSDTARRRAGASASRRAQKSVDKKLGSSLDYRFENEGRTILVIADVAKGWRRERHAGNDTPRKTYCFSEVIDAAWQGGTIHAHVSVFPRPGGLTEEWSTPPSLTFAGTRNTLGIATLDPESREITKMENVADYCIFKAEDGVLVASVDLQDETGAVSRLFDNDRKSLEPSSRRHTISLLCRPAFARLAI